MSSGYADETIVLLDNLDDNQIGHVCRCKMFISNTFAMQKCDDRKQLPKHVIFSKAGYAGEPLLG